MRQARGFTLYEMLVSIAMLGLLAAFAYQGLDQLLRSTERQRIAAERLLGVQRTLTQLASDLEQAQARPVREGYHGSSEPALRGGGAPLALELTRAGWRNPTGALHGPMQRVAYAVVDGKLVRSSWRVLDRAPDSLPVERELLAGVSGLEVAFLAEGSWQADWPPVGEGTDALLPAAVRVAFDLEGEGRIVRVVELVGGIP